jgi:fumarate reductase subunit D
MNRETTSPPRTGHSRFAPRPGPNRLGGILWMLFANAALLTALIVPAHILVQGVLAPMGLVPSFDRRQSTFASALNDPLVKLYLLLVIGASFYMAGHRVRYVIHELGVHGKLVVGVVMYGLAAAGTAVAAYLLFTLP